MMRRAFRHRVEVQTWLLVLTLVLSLLLAAMVLLHRDAQPESVYHPNVWYFTQEQPFIYANTPEEAEYAALTRR